MSDPAPEVPDESVDPEQAILHQDTYRKLVLGEVADPLFPPHPRLPETPGDELTRAALEDPAATQIHAGDPSPTVWRLVTLLVVAAAALAIVFWQSR